MQQVYMSLYYIYGKVNTYKIKLKTFSIHDIVTFIEIKVYPLFTFFYIGNHYF